MARELKVIFHHAGSPTLYGCLFEQATNKVWYPAGSVFETWGTGSRTADDYDLTVTHRGGSLWTADFPDGPEDGGLYRFTAYLQTGASPADGDAPVSNDNGRWADGEWIGTLGR